ncbi:hypothetical protein K8I85_17590, partial [bacterium]|nr:hypothetical protein [bacterium]
MGMDAGRIDTLVSRVIRRLEEEGALEVPAGAPREAGTASPVAPGHRAPSASAVVRSPRRPSGGPVFGTVDEAVAAARAAFLDLHDTPLETRNAM